MSELYSTIEESMGPILGSSYSNRLDNPDNNIPDNNIPDNNKEISPNSYIIDNIKNIIISILNVYNQDSYTNKDEITLDKCLFNFQYKLKSTNIPTNIKDSLLNVQKLINNIPDNKFLGDLYTLNNCLITFDETLNYQSHINTDQKIKENKKLSIYTKIILYIFIITILYYFYTNSN